MRKSSQNSMKLHTHDKQRPYTSCDNYSKEHRSADIGSYHKQSRMQWMMTHFDDSNQEHNSSLPNCNNFHNHLSSVQNIQTNEPIQVSNFNGKYAKNAPNFKVMKDKSKNSIEETCTRSASAKERERASNLFFTHGNQQKQSLGYLNSREKEETISNNELMHINFDMNMGKNTQNTNTWSQLANPQNLPEQIHHGNLIIGEGGLVTVGQMDSTMHNLTQENLKKLLVQNEEEEKATLNSQTAQNIQNFQSILSQMHSNWAYNQEGQPVADPKNLRNFFIQSSLTFNGNNINSNSNNKTNSVIGSTSQYEGNQSHQSQDKKMINQQEMPDKIGDSVPMPLAGDVLQEQPQFLPQSQAGESELESMHAKNEQMMIQLSMNPHNQNNSMNEMVLQQFQTQQPNSINDRHIMNIINEEGTSEFLSGPDLINLRGAFQGYEGMQQSGSKVFTSKANSQVQGNHRSIYQSN